VKEAGAGGINSLNSHLPQGKTDTSGIPRRQPAASADLLEPNRALDELQVLDSALTHGKDLAGTSSPFPVHGETPLDIQVRFEQS